MKIKEKQAYAFLFNDNTKSSVADVVEKLLEENNLILSERDHVWIDTLVENPFCVGFLFAHNYDRFSPEILLKWINKNTLYDGHLQEDWNVIMLNYDGKTLAHKFVVNHMKKKLEWS